MSFTGVLNMTKYHGYDRETEVNAVSSLLDFMKVSGLLAEPYVKMYGFSE